jgi:hypothetical protein
MRHALVFAALLLAAASFAAPAPAADLSGVYGPLTLGFDGDRVTGIFDEARVGNGSEEAPQFTCRFLLSGRLREGRAAIRTWQPGDAEVIEGMLAWTDDGAVLRLEESPPGCAMTSGLNAGEEFQMPRDEAGNWTSVRMVRAKRAYFHTQPKEFKRGKAYLLRGDTVRVVETQRDWVRAAFPAARSPVIGWLRSFDLEPATK